MKDKEPLDYITPIACPFCQSREWDELAKSGLIMIECQTCKAVGPGANNIFNAARLWNIRK